VGVATVDAYVSALPAGQQKIVTALRQIVKASAPQARESIKWAQPVYELGGPFAYIKAFKEHVNFGFWRGVEIDRGRGILHTGGSQMAHISLRSAKEIDRSLIASMVKDAVSLNQAKGDPTRKKG
jgi:hypothetical protein